MSDTLISILGSIASIISLIIVLSNKEYKNIVRGLVLVIVCLSILTSYLLFENRRYESEQYQKLASSFQTSLLRSSTARDAKALLDSFPLSIDRFNPGENEGIIYSVLRFLEANSQEFPELFAQFRGNVINDISAAKGIRGTSEHREILADGARASRTLLAGIANEYEN